MIITIINVNLYCMFTYVNYSNEYCNEYKWYWNGIA